LRGFERFPAWMWRNTDVLTFVGRLREHNDGCSDERDRTPVSAHVPPSGCEPTRCDPDAAGHASA
jgi:hypothetical protein